MLVNIIDTVAVKDKSIIESIPVKDRTEAVKVIKEKLGQWCQDGDRIGWEMTSKDTELNRKPSIAWVLTPPVWDTLDWAAVIVYEKGDKNDLIQ